MDQDEELEEGEISEDEPVTYTPLERPSNYSATARPDVRFPQLPPESDSEEEFQSSDSDSDSDVAKQKSKKPKMKIKPKLPALNPKQKKYDIWSTRVQEDVLAETLNSCDVTKKDRSRDVESYDYKIRDDFYDDDDRKNNKRSRDDRKNTNLKLVARPRCKKSFKGSARIILDLTVTCDDSAEAIAKDMANKLCEEKEDLIFRVVTSLGKDKAFHIFNETKRIEEEGGMLIMNQTRRRTPGGVFLFLVRHDYNITPEQKDSIFDEEKQKHKDVMKAKQKMKNKQLKDQVAASRKLLPDLLTRAELLANKDELNLNGKETDERDVVNPPPTPETDGHDNSGDGMDNLENPPVLSSNELLERGRRKLESYDDDFLDLGGSNDMDLF